MKNNSYKMFLLIFIFIFSFSFHTAYGKDDAGIGSLRETSKAFSSIARSVSPSVVFIKVESIQRSLPQSPFEWPFQDDLFKRFFGDQFPEFAPRQQSPTERRVLGQGSGFVFLVNKGMLSTKTYIITNNHVVEGAEKITVTFKDGSEYEAEISGADPKSDIAVLRIKDDKHAALTLGDSSSLEVGEWVVALGNPFGLSHTLTVGVVSAKGRTGLGINDYEDFIQTDAAINPGNSGGPLVNLDGEVVGINTAIFSRNGGYMGVGFAIPINLARGVAQQLIDAGEVTRGYLGIVIQELTPDLAESFGLKEIKGILIAQVTENSPAAKSGLKVGDLIVEYNGKLVSDIGDFRNRVALTQPGDISNIRIIRDGKPINLKVRIGNKKDEKALLNGPAQSSVELGLTVRTVTDDLAEKFELESGKGVLVTDVKPGSISDLAGLRKGILILQVNQESVNSADEFVSAFDKSKSSKKVLFLISDKGMSRYLVLRW